MYTDPDFATKKALKDAVAVGKYITIFSPGPFAVSTTFNGDTSVDGPHYPKPHTWYARVRVANGAVVKVIS